MVQQVQALANQVMRFDPIQYIKNAEYNLEKFIDMPDEQMIKDYTEQVLGGVASSSLISKSFVMSKVKSNNSKRG